MIAKPAQISFLSRINKLSLRKRHEVEMFDAFFIILYHAAAKAGFVNNFANILINHLLRRQLCVSPQTVAFLFRLDDRDIRVLVSLEPLVLAVSSAAAIPYTFHFCRTVDAVRIWPTSGILFREAI